MFTEEGLQRFLSATFPARPRGGSGSFSVFVKCVSLFPVRPACATTRIRPDDTGTWYETASGLVVAKGDDVLLRCEAPLVDSLVDFNGYRLTLGFSGGEGDAQVSSRLCGRVSLCVEMSHVRSKKQSPVFFVSALNHYHHNTYSINFINVS